MKCSPRDVARFVFTVLAVSLAQAGVHTTNLTFRPSQFHIESAGSGLQLAGQTYQLVLRDGMDVTDEAGAPQLPVQPVVIALAGLQQVTNVTFEVGEWQALEGQRLVLPCQKQQVLVAGTDLGPKPKGRSHKLALSEPRREERLLSRHGRLPARTQCDSSDSLETTGRGESNGPRAKAEDGPTFTAPDLSIYQSAEPYPASPARWTGTSYKTAWDTIRNGGHYGCVPRESTYVQVLVYPVRYIGAERRLEVCRSVKVGVQAQPHCQTGAAEAKAKVRSPSSPLPSPLGGEGERSEGEEAFGGVEYVIVTGQELDTVFRRLADWKTQRGVPAVVRTVEWVYANYAGRDQAEQLRNYVKTLPDSGAKYLLLAGDVDVVPFRKAFAMNCEWGAHPREDSLPCDFYFADLQGSWDANDNNVFGEVDDSVDLYADLSVGRAPVNDVAQAQTFVRKVLDYEHGAVAGYQNKGLFFAEVLWQEPYTDMAVHKNKLGQRSFGSGYSLTKLYQSLGNETRAAVMQAMRENQNFMNHDGHGWIDVMQCGGSANRMRTADADTITNDGLGIMYSVGCWTTAFDLTSIGEAFVTNPNGGAVAFVGNSSYGWGSPGNPGFGYSDKFDDLFWHAVTSEGEYHVGDALNAAKEYYAPFSHDENVYRWHQYQLNLMGDPEMPIWTASPESLAVDAPSSVGIGPGRYLFSVSGPTGPVAGALACLSRAGDVHSRGLTDNAGRVWLDVDPLTPGSLKLTATAHDFFPFTSEVACDSGDFVNFAGWSVDDQDGNDDGIANPGETVSLPFLLCNTGTDTTGPATVTLLNSDPRVTLLDSVVGVPSIAPGDSLPVESGLRLSIGAGANDGAAVKFRLEIAGGCFARTYLPVLQIGEPVLALGQTWLSWPLLPGTSRYLGASIENFGHGYGHSTWCRLVSFDSFVSVVGDSVWLGEIEPLTSDVAGDSFEVLAAVECPTGHVALMELQVNADGFFGRDTFELLVGDHGFADDMESGESKWSHGGTGDMWHTSSVRAHSGTRSWYCGSQSTHEYNSGMDAWLTTIPFVVTQDCSLSFWRWFSTPNYGVDGIRVIVAREAAEETLDFLGTGGALGETGTVPRVLALRGTVPVFRVPFTNRSGWAEETYDLSWLGVGETIRVKLVFVSDGDTVDEGFYIDDVRVTGGRTGAAGVESGPEPFPGLDVWPSPFRSVAQIRYGAAGEPPQLRVYDIAGRMVRHLPAERSAVWDGRDQAGQRLPAGAYFIEARTRHERRLVKVLLAR